MDDKVKQFLDACQTQKTGGNASSPTQGLSPSPRSQVNSGSRKPGSSGGILSISLLAILSASGAFFGGVLFLVGLYYFWPHWQAYVCVLFLGFVLLASLSEVSFGKLFIGGLLLVALYYFGPVLIAVVTDVHAHWDEYVNLARSVGIIIGLGVLFMAVVYARYCED